MQADDRAYFRNGRLQYNNRPPPHNGRTPPRRPDSPSTEDTESLSYLQYERIAASPEAAGTRRRPATILLLASFP